MDTLTLIAQQHLRTHSARVGRPGEGSNQEDSTLQGMTDAQVRAVPQAGMNSVAWVLWHMARSEDQAVHLLGGRKQVFEEGSWAAKMKVADRHTGSGHTPADVARVSGTVDLAALRDYRVAVGMRTQEILRAMKPADLAGTVDLAAVRRGVSVGAWGESPDAAAIEKNWSVRTKGYAVTFYGITHNVGHWGEVTTIKGLLSAK